METSGRKSIVLFKKTNPENPSYHLAVLAEGAGNVPAPVNGLSHGVFTEGAFVLRMPERPILRDS